jgi:hypothetical protein
LLQAHRSHPNNALAALDLGQLGEDRADAARAGDQRASDNGQRRAGSEGEQQRDGDGQHETNPFKVWRTGESRHLFPLSSMFSICSVASSLFCAGSLRSCLELMLDFPIHCR